MRQHFESFSIENTALLFQEPDKNPRTRLMNKASDSSDSRVMLVVP
jgi:hypothetical protein